MGSKKTEKRRETRRRQKLRTQINLHALHREVSLQHSQLLLEESRTVRQNPSSPEYPPLSGRLPTTLEGDINPAVRAIVGFSPYQETSMKTEEVCCFLFTWMWNPSLLMKAGLRAITIKSGFETRDAHLQTITTLPALCSSLEIIQISDSTLLTDRGIMDLVTWCPNLKTLSLKAAVNLTDISFKFILTRLPKLEILSITGRATTTLPFVASDSGKLTKKSLNLLFSQATAQSTTTITSKLKRLELMGHDLLSPALARKLTAKRALEIVIGSKDPLYCTFWRGELVHVRNNPVYDYIVLQKEKKEETRIETISEADAKEQEEDYHMEGEVADELEFTPEDYSYDTFLSADFLRDAYLDSSTGKLMPANSFSWDTD